jgi:hypothetical protein
MHLRHVRFCGTTKGSTLPSLRANTLAGLDKAGLTSDFTSNCREGVIVQIVLSESASRGQSLDCSDGGRPVIQCLSASESEQREKRGKCYLHSSRYGILP